MSKEIKYLVEEKNNEIDIFLLLKIIKNNIKFAIYIFLIFIMISVAYVFTKPKEYYASFPIQIYASVSSTIVNDLKNSSKFSKADLIQNIKFTQEEVKHLNFIQISKVSNENNKNVATINISTNSPEYLSVFYSKIVDWVSNNPQVIEIINNKNIKIDNLIDKADKQLLDIKTFKTKTLNSTSNTSERQPFSFRDEFSIYETKLKFVEQKENLKAVTALSQIFIPTKAKNASKSIPMFFSFIISGILSLIVTLVFKFKM